MPCVFGRVIVVVTVVVVLVSCDVAVALVAVGAPFYFTVVLLYVALYLPHYKLCPNAANTLLESGALPIILPTLPSFC